jgi:hypothetical protein
MSDRDLPTDVRDTLRQLLSEAAAAARERDPDTAVDLLDTVERVAENKLPEGDLRARLLFGAERARRLAADEPLVAAEYCRAMRDLL